MSMHTKDRKAIVIGGNHQNPLGVVESLARVGIRPYVIIYDDYKSSFVLKSRYIRKGFICPTPESAIQKILDLTANEQEKAVVIACSDNASLLINQYFDILTSFCYLPTIPNQDEMGKWMDKEQMDKVAVNVGLDVPQTLIIVKGSPIPSDIDYPVVTKSLTSVGLGKAEFTICANEEELKVFVETQMRSGRIQVQKYIEKEYEFQFIGCSFHEGKDVIIPGRTYIENATHFNNLTFLKYQERKVIEGTTTLLKTESFIEQTGYSGLFSVEYMHGKDGKDYFLEMNFRNDGNAFVVTQAGANLPYLWYLSCIGEDYRSYYDEDKVTAACFLPEDSFFLSMLSGNISYKEWRMKMKEATCFASYFKGDTKPFWSLIWWQKRAFFLAAFFRLLQCLHLYNFAQRIKHLGR